MIPPVGPIRLPAPETRKVSFSRCFGCRAPGGRRHHALACQALHRFEARLTHVRQRHSRGCLQEPLDHGVTAPGSGNLPQAGWTKFTCRGCYHRGPAASLTRPGALGLGQVLCTGWRAGLVAWSLPAVGRVGRPSGALPAPQRTLVGGCPRFPRSSVGRATDQRLKSRPTLGSDLLYGDGPVAALHSARQAASQVATQPNPSGHSYW